MKTVLHRCASITIGRGWGEGVQGIGIQEELLGKKKYWGRIGITKANHSCNVPKYLLAAGDGAFTFIRFGHSDHQSIQGLS